jgi:hypothetical protein
VHADQVEVVRRWLTAIAYTYETKAECDCSFGKLREWVCDYFAGGEDACSTFHQDKRRKTPTGPVVTTPYNLMVEFLDDVEFHLTLFAHYAFMDIRDMGIVSSSWDEAYHSSLKQGKVKVGRTQTCAQAFSTCYVCWLFLFVMLFVVII